MWHQGGLDVKDRIWDYIVYVDRWIAEEESKTTRRVSNQPV